MIAERFSIAVKKKSVNANTLTDQSQDVDG